MRDVRLEISLLLLRVSVFAAMLVWTLDKFVDPGHFVHIFESFYGVAGVASAIVWIVGIIELAILLAFAVGFARAWTYGFVVVAHGLSTLVSFGNYAAPFAGVNLLFFAAWPMWAASIALFLLRDHDRLLSLGR